jgi:PIN domain nuclease of toxin-antitoxin system
MTTIVLDSSALLALILGERRAGKVAAVVNGAWMSSVNFAEVVGYFAKRGADDADIRRYLGSFPLAVASFDPESAYLAGLLRPLGEKVGLSLGDRACRSLARSRNARAMTADRAGVSIAAAYGVWVEMIR